jgi:hypothetical protein
MASEEVEREGEDRVHVTQNRDGLWAFLNKIMRVSVT